MKKRWITICLALIFALTPSSAGFLDITDRTLAQNASILDALGIMQGIGNDQFDPAGSLTRAQFCKIAVTAMGVSDVSAYKNFTIFPDVKNTHWAAAYVNAAVRHPDLRERAVIRGYVDGTFGPDRAVNYGEVCTMLLRMLGYTEEDVGLFWPADYIAKAEELGLTDGVSISDAKAVVKRSDAATMLVNVLTVPVKDSQDAVLLDGLVSEKVDGCILLATSDTNNLFADSEALFYEDGVISGIPRQTVGTLDSAMIGVYGTMLLKDGAVAGIVPDKNSRVEVYEVISVSASEIQTSTQTIRPAENAHIYVDSVGASVGTFGELWSSIQPGDTLRVYFDATGAQQLMAVLSNARPHAVSFMYHV
nr:S-layer homology domain-containing protein [uncultured Agathobaculum sp.]